MKPRNFTIFITQDADGFFVAKVPNLPGCHTQAKTLPTLFKRTKEAIALCNEVESDKRLGQERFVGIQQIEV